MNTENLRWVVAALAALGISSCTIETSTYDGGCDSFYSDCGGGWDDGDDWGNDDDGDWGDDGGNDDDDWGDDGGDDGDDDDGTYCDGTGFCYQDGNPSTGRDTVAKVGEEEFARIQSAGKKFASKFALSEETGVNVAKAFYDWRTLSKTRARTKKDVAKFTQRLYGVEMSRVTMALSELEKGNSAPMEGAIEDAADHWGTTPETMKQILKDWYKDYL